MQVIQSFWTAPLCVNSETRNRHPAEWSGGWRSPRYHYMGWALSCLLLKKHYGSVHLATDRAGKAFLINDLGLPYDHVTTGLDSIANFANYWAFGKLWTYSQQTRPFVHVDGDIFINQPVFDTTAHPDLIVQNEEDYFYSYQLPWREMQEHFTDIPALLTQGCPRGIIAYNCGFFGGYNLPFIKQYAQSAIDFIAANKAYHPKTNVAIIYEQTLLRMAADAAQLHVEIVMPGIRDYSFYNKVCDIMGFLQGYPFIHALGDWKQNEHVCHLIEDLLLIESPELYDRLTERLGEAGSTVEAIRSKAAS
jgi:hypothetical protein